MKKIGLFLLFSVIISLCVNAQTEKYKLIIGGSSSFNYSQSTITTQTHTSSATTSYDVKMKSMEFSPYIGYFVIDNLAICLDFSYSQNKYKVGSSYTDPEKTLGVGLDLKYFFLKNNYIKPYLSAGVGLISKQELDDQGKATEENKASGVAFGGEAGLAFFITDAFAINAGVSYSNAKIKNKKDDANFTKPVVISFGIGLSYTFDAF